MGTHAHELMMMTAQLLAAYDDKAGTQTGSPVPIAALLAHLLFLCEVGGLAEPTALSDTFGTEAFIEVGLTLPALGQCAFPSFTPGVLACLNFVLHQPYLAQYPTYHAHVRLQM